MQNEVAQHELTVDVENKINMIIKNSINSRLQQHKNLLSDRGLDREGTNQNLFFTQVQKDAKGLYQKIEEKLNEDNWQGEEILTGDGESELEKGILVREHMFDRETPSKRAKIKKVRDTQVQKYPHALYQKIEETFIEEDWPAEEISISDEESNLENRIIVPEDVFDTERPSEKAKIKKVRETQVQKELYALYQTIKEMFNKENWPEEELLTSDEESELEKGRIGPEDVFDTEISSKSGKKVTEVFQKKRISKMTSTQNVEREKELEIMCNTKLPCVNSLRGWHSNNDVYMRQSIIMIIIKIIEHLQPNASKFVKNLPYLAESLEQILYESSCTKEDYSDLSTLKKRLLKLVNMD